MCLHSAWLTGCLVNSSGFIMIIRCPAVFLPGESQGWGILVGCRLWGRTGSPCWFHPQLGSNSHSGSRCLKPTPQHQGKVGDLTFCGFLLKERKLFWRASSSFLSHLISQNCSSWPLLNLGGSMGFSRQEYWSGVPLPSPFNPLWFCKLKYLKPLPYPVFR